MGELILRNDRSPELIQHSVNTHGKWANSVQSQSTAAILRSTQLQDKAAAWRELRAGVNAQKNKCSQLRQNIEMMEAQIHKGIQASWKLRIPADLL
jgi:hypothetical protein